MLGLFDLGDGQALLLLALLLIFFGATRIADIARALGNGFFHFRREARKVVSELDKEAEDAGESLGGIYGKPAAQALTHDNQTAELYDPAAFHNSSAGRFRTFRRLFQQLKHLYRHITGLLKTRGRI